MRRFFFLVLGLGLAASGCVERDFGAGEEADGPVEERDLVTREDRRTGTVSLAEAKALVVENAHGTVVIEGNGRPGEIRWFTHTLTRGRAGAEAQARQDSIGIRFSFDADTVFVTLDAPLGTIPVMYAGLVSLTVPHTLPARVAAFAVADVSDLDADLAVRAEAAVVRRHTGSLDLTTRHDATLQLALPPGGHAVAVSDSGDVALSLPADTDATVELLAQAGTITVSNLSFVSQNRQPGKLTGTLGSGDGTLRLTARRGDVRLTGF